LASKPAIPDDSRESTNRSVWRWNFGIGIVFVGAALMYAIHFQDWKMAQMASIFGVALVIAGIVLLTTNITSSLRGENGPDNAPPDEKRQDNAQPNDKGQENTQWLTRLVWVAAFGMGIVVLYAVQFQDWVMARVASTAAVGLMAAGAAWLVGALFGFIFGLPHSREVTVIQPQNSLPHDSDSSVSQSYVPDRYQRSTSLEQVSDWLTKMIVGVGLTQLDKIPQKLNQLAGYISQGFLSGNTPEKISDHVLAVNSAFALAICIYFAVDGFLFGFLWACLDLFELFRSLDNKNLQRRLQKTEARSENAEYKAAVAPDVTYDVLKARDEVAAIEQKKRTNQPLDTNRAQEFIKKLTEYSSTFPTNRPLHIVLANLYLVTDQFDMAVDTLRHFIAVKEKAGQMDDDLAAAWYNLACYYSIQSEKLQDGPAKQNLLKQAESALTVCFETAQKSGPTTLAIHLDASEKDKNKDLSGLSQAGLLEPTLKRFRS
jgi:hypothetical protein